MITTSKDLGLTGLESPPRNGTPPFDLRPRRDLCSRRVWRERSRRALRFSALVTGDTLAVAVALGIVLGVFSFWTDAAAGWMRLFPLTVVVLLGGQAILGTYGPNGARKNYERVLMATVASVAVVSALGVTYPTLAMPLPALAFFAVVSCLLFCGVRLAAESVIRRLYARGLFRRPTLIIGDHEHAWEILEHLLVSGEMFTHVVGHLAPEPAKDPTALGGLDMLSSLIEKDDIRSVIVSAHLDTEAFRDITTVCFEHGTPVSVVPATISGLPCRVSPREFHGWPLIELQMPRLHLAQVILKRTVDLALSAFGLLLLSPLLVLLAVAVKLDSPGPVFFRQKRLGLGGEPFTIFKFRSMRADAEEILAGNEDLQRRYRENGFKLPESEDPRISAFGAFLRKSSLDEIPQLFNVLTGDMSLVGPRPIVVRELENYGEGASTFLAVRPGVTGRWQINGRSEVGYPQRALLDIEYIREWSLASDLGILLRTVPAVLNRNGAH